MGRNRIYLVVIIAMVFFIVACSSIQPGQTVWINLPGKSIASEGYAVAKLTKIVNGKAYLRVSKIRVFPGTYRTLWATLKGRKAVISSGLLLSYKEGKAAWNDRRKATRYLGSLLRSNKINSSKESFVDQVVDNNEIAEFNAALSLYRLRKNYLSATLPMSSRVGNISLVLDKLKSLAKEHKAYQTILNHLSARVIYATSDNKNSVSVVTKFVKFNRKQKRMSSNLFTRRAAATILEIRQIIQSAINGRMSGLQLANKLSILKIAEKDYLNFVTDSGKRYSKMPIDKILSIRQRQIASKILPGIRTELVTNAQLGTVTSESEAVLRYETAADQAKNLGEKLNLKVFPKSAKQQWFVLPVRRRLASLKRQQKFRYQVALNRNQPPKAQQRAIKLYLSNYPEGQFVDKVKEEQKLFLQRQKLAMEIRQRRLKMIIGMLTSRNHYKGVAGYQKKTLHFKIKISKFNKKNGKFSGRITWPEKKGAVNKITGKFNSDKLSIRFTEVTAIKKGSWRTGSKYHLSMVNDKNMKGIHSYRYFVFPKQRTASIKIN